MLQHIQLRISTEVTGAETLAQAPLRLSQKRFPLANTKSYLSWGCVSWVRSMVEFSVQFARM